MSKFADTGDKVAIGLSFICVLHCIAFPIALILLPSLVSVLALDDQAFHRWVAFVVIPISSIALWFGYLHHKRLNVFMISVLGMAVLVLTALFGHEALGERWEVVFTLFGSGLIAFGHIRNYRLRRNKPCAGSSRA